MLSHSFPIAGTTKPDAEGTSSGSLGYYLEKEQSKFVCQTSRYFLVSLVVLRDLCLFYYLRE